MHHSLVGHDTASISAFLVVPTLMADHLLPFQFSASVNLAELVSKVPPTTQSFTSGHDTAFMNS